MAGLAGAKKALRAGVVTCLSQGYKWRGFRLPRLKEGSPLMRAFEKRGLHAPMKWQDKGDVLTEAEDFRSVASAYSEAAGKVEGKFSKRRFRLLADSANRAADLLDGKVRKVSKR